MFFVLSKILSFILYPINWIVLLFILSVVFRKSKKGHFYWIAAIVMFFFFSNRFVFSEVMKFWEGGDRMKVETKYDAVVVLGGYSSWDERHGIISFNESSDRLLEAVQLYHTGKVEKILLAGGSGLVLKPDEKESDFIHHFLTRLNVDSADILIESESRNTYQNAISSTKILEQEFGIDGQFLLITSAYHMPRAAACFDRAGLDFDRFKVDFKVDDDDYTLETFLLPSASTLDEWQTLFREWVGYVVYWLRGYL